ncbi:11962_t:CDS:2, partial [Racocetra fulgida]
MKSLANDGDKNHKQSSSLEIDEIKFILNSPTTAVDNPKGGDAKRLKISWLKELDNDGMLLELSKEKNYMGGIKDPYTESGSSLIPPDISENVYTLVADIQKYLSKCSNNVVDDYFFISINTSKKDFKGHCITNHSMRSMGIHNLVELGVILDGQMIFSRHKTIARVSAYQHQLLKRKRDNVSFLILIEEAALKDSTSSYINKGFFKASNLLSNEFNKIDSEANANNELKTNVDNKSETKTNNEVNSDMKCKK